jgi:hypothetical protein
VARADNRTMCEEVRHICRVDGSDNVLASLLREPGAQSLHCRAAQPFWGAAMTQDILGALWFIMLLISIYGMVTGDLCLWRRND